MFLFFLLYLIVLINNFHQYNHNVMHKQTTLVDKYNKYIVGEKIAHKYPYDDIFELIIAKNDLHIQDKLKKGYLFGKYVTMAIYNFLILVLILVLFQFLVVNGLMYIHSNHSN
jgi:hypothetical protein